MHVETAAEYAAGCPSCGVVSTAVKANAFIYTGTTNARTEGINRLIKQVKRSACGFRNTANIRRRIRFHCTRAQRGEQPQP